jgi:hypothetical protein
MPCNGVAVVRAQVAVSLSEMLTVPGAIDALTALINQTHQVKEIQVTPYGIDIEMRNGEDVNVDLQGRIYASSTRLTAAVKTYLEELSMVLLVQVAAQKIRETSRVRSEQYVDGGALVLSVEI